jgi:coenzyme F420 biosynthesis associated uncharacterized protein
MPAPAGGPPPVDLIDWDLAVTTAKRLMRPGPEVTRDDARETVAELRRCAEVAEGHVRAYTGLSAGPATAPVLIVDRAGWVQANTDGLRLLIQPLLDNVRDKRGDPSPVAAAIGSRVTGVEVGGLLAYLSSKVLGQFDPFSGVASIAGSAVDGTAASSQAPAGRLLLVAPNVVHVEQELEVDPHDFRLWVCLHEETHRVQFTAVPWLRGYLLGEIATLLGATELDPQKLAAMLREGLEQVGRMLRGNSDASLLDLVQTPEQKEVLERVTAVMSLLEGHADVVMDGVGPQVVPSVEEIRRKFTKRRAGAGPLDQMIRKLLGFDAKLRQYRDGAVFVRGVVAKVGMDGFNAVWASAENLPSRAEIADPARWVARVHG